MLNRLSTCYTKEEVVRRIVEHLKTGSEEKIVVVFHTMPLSQAEEDQILSQIMIGTEKLRSTGDKTSISFKRPSLGNNDPINPFYETTISVSITYAKKNKKKPKKKKS